MKRTVVLVSALALLAAGCSTKYEVESDTTWTGFVDHASVEGSGSRTYSAESHSSATFMKSTDGGMLRARAKGWHGDGKWHKTTAPYGAVTVSTD